MDRCQSGPGGRKRVVKGLGTVLEILTGGYKAMQFGMPTLVENKTLQENVDLCKSLGLSFIELNMNFPEYQVDRLEQVDTLIRAAEEAGIYYTIHLDENLNIADFNPLVTDAYLETVRRSIEVAKKLLPLRDRYGDRSQPLTLNMHMHHGIHITLPDRKVQMYDRDFDTYMESFAKFRTLCEEWIADSDIRIVVENTNGFRGYEKKAAFFAAFFCFSAKNRYFCPRCRSDYSIRH